MKVAVCILLLALPVAAQHEKEGEKKKHPFIGDAKEIEAGKRLFAEGCAVCHGPDGQGGRGPNLREQVFWHPLDDDTIYKSLKNGIKGGMPAVNLPEDDLWRVVAYVRSLTSPAAENPAPGDASAGEVLFWGKGGCGKCHGIRGKGGKLGPDLSNVGSVRPLPMIRDSIIDPDANGAVGYRAATVTLRSGKTLKGVARNRTNYSLQLQDADGNLHLVNMADVTALTLGAGSPMPKDFAKKLDETEIENLTAFLARQTVRKIEAAKK